MARERLGDNPSSLTPLTEPQFGKLVDEVLGSTEPSSRGSIERIVAEWERDRALTGSPAIGIHPLRNVLAGMAGY